MHLYDKRVVSEYIKNSQFNNKKANKAIKNRQKMQTDALVNKQTKGAK